LAPALLGSGYGSAASTVTRYCVAPSGDEILLVEPEQTYRYNYWHQSNRRSETGSFEYINKGVVRFKRSVEGVPAVAVSGMGPAAKAVDSLRFSFKNARQQPVTLDFLKRRCSQFP